MGNVFNASKWLLPGNEFEVKGLILAIYIGVNTLYRLFCFFELFPMVGKGLGCGPAADLDSE